VPRLVFHGEDGSASVDLPDRLGINLAGGELNAGGPILATHADGLWRIGNVPVTRITCDGPTYFEFQANDVQRSFGPFTALVIGASTISAAEGCVARYSAFTKSWYLYTADGAEPLVVAEPINLAPA
jgi:hypothetical protein